jgi:hypothetical protein
VSDTRAKTPGWSSVVAEQFAERVIEVADLRRAEMGWTRERTIAVVGATTDAYVDSIAESLRDAAAMALDVWAASWQ